MQVIGAGQQELGDRAANSSVPFFSNNPETFTNPVARWKQLVAMYRTSWECRKIINIIPDDACRKQFLLKGISEASARIIKKKFDRLQLIPALKRSLKLERLLGGCLTFLGLESEEDDPSRVYKPREGKKLHFLNSIPLSRISRMSWDTNPLSPNYMRPKSFYVNNIDVSVSRCLVWDGEPLFDSQDFALTNYQANLAGFGSSVIGAIYDDIVQACGTRQAAYQLIQVNGAIIAAVQDLQDLAGTEPGQKNLRKIEQLAQQLSAYRVGMIDAEKVQLSNNSVSFGSVPELLLLFLQVLSAASDIPATRFLGQAPGGLNATGDSDLQNYYNVIDSYQREHIAPQLLRLCDIVGYAEIPGWEKERDDLEIEFPPMWNETAKEEAERAALTIDNVLKLVDAALMGDEQALEEINARGILSVTLEKDDLMLLQDAQDAVSRVMDGGETDDKEGAGEADSKKQTDSKKQIDRLKNMGRVKNGIDLDELIVTAGGDPDTVGLNDFEMGWKAEQEHRGSLSKDREPNDDLQIARAVLDHLREDPDYYQKLKKIENGFPTKTKTKVHGLPISIETAAGEERKGVCPRTKQVWSCVMPCDYGEFDRHDGADGDKLDVFVGPDTQSEKVFILDQRDVSTFCYDESKVILQVGSLEEARDLYASSFSDDRGLGRIMALSELTLEQFHEWRKNRDTTKPYHMSLEGR